MDEYINRELALKAKVSHYSANGVEIIASEAIPVKYIENLPAADVRPVKSGKWLPDYDFAEYDFDGITPLLEPRKFQDGWQCSLCGGYMTSKTNFCPNCGADMREES